ncbi:NAD-dependent epimerase/dehydratase family protein [Candidatus Pacearchaeota archaeon]|nr:NAD-dependent epimerase/dehydratase family protein [Candidatus Pacearchaeota archaeon]
MNILITGCDGFIGNALVGKLKNRYNKVIGFGRERNMQDKKLHTPDVFIQGDVRDYDLLRRVITDYEIDEVYHLAAQAIVRTCSNDPYSTFDINVMGTVSLLEACRNSGQNVKSITISTSDKAFGDAPIPYTEETQLNPQYVYDTSKGCQQFVSRCYFNNYNVPTKVVACSNIYGPADFNMSRIIPNTVTRLAKGQPALLNKGVADYIREFVFIDDAANAFIAVSRNGTPGETYCCGGTEHLPIKELIERICTMMGKDFSEIELFERPSQFKEIPKQQIDSTKLRSLGWAPQYTLNEGLQKSIEFYSDLVKN